MSNINMTRLAIVLFAILIAQIKAFNSTVSAETNGVATPTMISPATSATKNNPSFAHEIIAVPAEDSAVPGKCDTFA